MIAAEDVSAHLPRAAARCASSASTSSCCSASGSSRAGARPGRLGGALRPHRSICTARCASRSSASTCSFATRTCRWSRRSSTAPSTTASPSSSTGWTPRACRGARPSERLRRVDGVLIPGGFGPRAIEGKVAAVRYAREQGVPFLGICLGMQCAAVEFARNVCDMPGANSTEFDPATAFPVVDLLPEQKDIEDMGGTMRLGAEPVEVRPGTRAHASYGEGLIYERHRHRYEVNNALRPQLEARGLVVSGVVRGQGSRRDPRAARSPLVRGEPVPPRSSRRGRRGPSRCSAISSAPPSSTAACVPVPSARRQGRPGPSGDDRPRGGRRRSLLRACSHLELARPRARGGGRGRRVPAGARPRGRRGRHGPGGRQRLRQPLLPRASIRRWRARARVLLAHGHGRRRMCRSAP